MTNHIKDLSSFLDAFNRQRSDSAGGEDKGSGICSTRQTVEIEINALIYQRMNNERSNESDMHGTSPQ